MTRAAYHGLVPPNRDHTESVWPQLMTILFGSYALFFKPTTEFAPRLHFS